TLWAIHAPGSGAVTMRPRIDESILPRDSARRVQSPEGGAERLSRFQGDDPLAGVDRNLEVVQEVAGQDTVSVIDARVVRDQEERPGFGVSDLNCIHPDPVGIDRPAHALDSSGTGIVSGDAQ